MSEEEGEDLISSQVPPFKISAKYTQGGSKTHRIVGEKAARESTSGSEAGSPKLAQRKSPSSSKQDKKRKKADKHKNF